MSWWKRITARKWFPISVFLVLICLAAAFYTGMTGNEGIASGGVRRLLIPAQKSVTHAAVKVANVYNRIMFFDDLVQENEELKQKVSDLETELENASDALDENEELRDMLGVAQRNTSMKYEEAEVVARQMDEWSSVLTIDSGKKDGLSLYDSVVNSDGLIGYITDLSAHSAEITTVLDPNLQCGAKIIGTDELGVAQGDYQLMSDGKLKVSYLNRDATIGKGSKVQTSGSGGVFPAGLTIGTVESVDTAADGMSAYALVQPSVKVSNVTRVFVITDYSVSN